MSLGGAGSSVGGRYLLLATIGRGGMGRIWRAQDEVLDREVAAKEILLPEGLAEEERGELIERTMREARAAARLSHPGIVAVHDVVREGEVPWIIMELVSGGSLADLLKHRGRLDWRRTAELGAQVAEALEHAHRHGVVHRDIKPGNILISDDRAVITDFGIARVLDSGAQLTVAGSTLGTPRYMSPEQVEGGDVGPASDVWSLGALLYQMVEGRTPFAQDTMAATFAAILNMSPPPAEHAGPLGPLLGAVLAKDPALRPGCGDLARMLRGLSAEDAVAAWPVGSVGSVGSVGDAGAAAARTGSPVPVPAPVLDAAELAHAEAMARESAHGGHGVAPVRHGSPQFRGPAPAGGSSPGRRRLGWRVRGALWATGGGIILAVVVLIIVSTLGKSSSGNGYTPDTSVGGMAQAWSGTVNTTENDNATYVGVWITGSEVAAADQDGVTAFAAGTGDTLWSWSPPQNENICALSTSGADGVGIVAYGAAAQSNSASNSGYGACQDMMAVNLDTGRNEWSAPVSLVPHDSTTTGVGEPGLALSASTLTVLDADGNVSAYAPATGTLLWSTASSSKAGVDADCNGRDRYFDVSNLVASATTAYVDYSCVAAGASSAYTNYVLGFSLANGAPDTHLTMTGACRTTEVSTLAYEGRYLLTDCTASSSSTENLEALPVPATAGAVSTQESISYANGGLDAVGLTAEQEVECGFAVSGDTLYAETGSSESESIRATDLENGKQLWVRKAVSDANLLVVGANPAGVLAVSVATLQNGDSTKLALVELSAASGAQTTGSSLSGGGIGVEASDSFYLAGTRLVDVMAAAEGDSSIVTDYSGVSIG
jgi:hypothetical protein